VSQLRDEHMSLNVLVMREAITVGIRGHLEFECASPLITTDYH
jgi:hypothetical protein